MRKPQRQSKQCSPTVCYGLISGANRPRNAPSLAFDVSLGKAEANYSENVCSPFRPMCAAKFSRSRNRTPKCAGSIYPTEETWKAGSFPAVTSNRFYARPTKRLARFETSGPKRPATSNCEPRVTHAKSHCVAAGSSARGGPARASSSATALNC